MCATRGTASRSRRRVASCHATARRLVTPRCARLLPCPHSPAHRWRDRRRTSWAPASSPSSPWASQKPPAAACACPRLQPWPPHPPQCGRSTRRGVDFVATRSAARPWRPPRRCVPGRSRRRPLHRWWCPLEEGTTTIAPTHPAPMQWVIQRRGTWAKRPRVLYPCGHRLIVAYLFGRPLGRWTVVLAAGLNLLLGPPQMLANATGVPQRCVGAPAASVFPCGTVAGGGAAAACA